MRDVWISHVAYLTLQCQQNAEKDEEFDCINLSKALKLSGKVEICIRHIFCH